MPADPRPSPGHTKLAGFCRRCLLGVVLAATAIALFGRAQAAEPVTVFAAASLTDAMEEAVDAYEKDTGRKVRLSFASSSTLARQIEAGAPADIYVSANQRWMDHLKQAGLIAPGTRRSPIGNALVLIAPADVAPGPVEISRELDIAGLLGAKGWLAVGDPAHVPAGIYAEQALTRLGQWDGLKDRLARTDHVRAALALVGRGEARLGIVYPTDARISDRVEVIGTFPPDSHRPITYPFAIVAGQDRADVRSLFDHLTGAAGIEVFERFGFVTR
ncbi:MAG: molybdate ABC transporter substrate-binding protein [Hyphomicrobiales bacterium]